MRLIYRHYEKQKALVKLHLYATVDRPDLYPIFSTCDKVLGVYSQLCPLYTEGTLCSWRKGLSVGADYKGRVAQLVEQVTFNHWVTGSNPVPLTIISR